MPRQVLVVTLDRQILSLQRLVSAQDSGCRVRARAFAVRVSDGGIAGRDRRYAAAIHSKLNDYR